MLFEPMDKIEYLPIYKSRNFIMLFERKKDEGRAVIYKSRNFIMLFELMMS